jgi:hypothetical protein
MAPERNQSRCYLMQTTQTMFGEWSQLRHRGRIVSPGKARNHMGSATPFTDRGTYPK